MELPRDASQQVMLGEEVTLANARAGDVAFFTNNAGRVIHVGILVSNRRIIHASGRVKIDKLDQQGIWSEELKTYSHTLFKIKRLN
jgi:cell wall-associated NlpC family hydrolase